MKALNCLLICLTTLAFNSASGQQPPAPTPPNAPVLTKFNLDFPGGTPKQLANAIEKAMGRPFNKIIPNEDDDLQLPPLKMNNVDIAQLFSALQQASKFTPVGYGFMTEGARSDDSVWSFVSDRHQPPPLPKVCRFYALSRYLERGLKVEDIITAVQTGWKMQGDTSPPQINYHKETKLLIAVGEPDKLEIINAVLQTLDSSKASAPTPVPAKAKAGQ